MRIGNTIILLLLTINLFAQNSVKGKISLVGEDGFSFSKYDSSSGDYLYRVKYSLYSKKKKRRKNSNVIQFPIKLWNENKLVKEVKSNTDGTFQLPNIPNGTYRFDISTGSIVWLDTLIQVETDKTLELALSGNKFWDYVYNLKKDSLLFTRETALQDIQDGKIQLLRYGLNLESNSYDLVTTKYSFKYIGAYGCVVSYWEKRGLEEYNKAMNEYLDTINPPNWRVKMEQEVREVTISVLKKW